MTSANWIRQYEQMDDQAKAAAIKSLGRDKNLALVILSLAFVALLVSCAQEFHLDTKSVIHLDPQSMFVMSVSAAICAAIGAVMWLRMEVHIRFLELLGEIKK